MIQYLKYNEIDFKKYDDCIDMSNNTRIYAYSYYLDVVADNWDALVFNDYEYVMPLTWRRKYLVKYIYNPCWTQQLGIFSSKELSKEIIELFIKSIPKSFLKFSINFNSFNSNYDFKNEKVNYILPLNSPYEQLFKNYKYVRRRTKKIIDERNIEIIKSNDFEAIIELFVNEKQDEVALKIEDYNKLKRLISNFQAKDKVDIVLAKNSEDGLLLGGAIFLKDKKRITYLFSSVTQRGRDEQVMTSIIDLIIKNYANTDFILDFEGSMIPGIAFFFKSFGAKQEIYFNYQKSLSF